MGRTNNIVVLKMKGANMERKPKEKKEKR